MIQRDATKAAVRSAFTLMEMLVVVAILVVLAGAAVPIYLNYLENAKVDRCKADVKALTQAVQAYNTRYGDYPQSLEVLTTRNPQDGSKATLSRESLLDPWNRPYVYEPHTIHPDTGVPRIYSQGPPSSQGQIANWNQ